MKLGVICDGISRNLKHAVDVMDEFDLEYAELQFVDDKEVGDHSADQIKAIDSLLRDRGKPVSCLSRHIFAGMTIDGDLVAQRYIVSSSVSIITSSFSSGSTIFGDTQDDVHAFTGSVNIKDGDILVTTTGGYFQVDTSDNSAKHADNTKAKFGTGNDFQIWHDGSNTCLLYTSDAADE